MDSTPTPSAASPLDPAPAAADAGWLALDRQLCFALYSASLSMTKLYKPLLDPLGLTYPQYLVMLALWERDGETVGQLGARLFLDSGTLTPLLKRLEAQGLLQRRRDAADERRVLLSLTTAGRDLRERAQAVPRAVACATACELDEIIDLTQRLQNLRRRLVDAQEGPAPAADSPPDPAG
ncbi:MarR family winged helix-turn-helix transcriptional regulator [Sphaerotilus microaerophilus]|jgi:DNA-binding MarR family transcriptional regulator|uniref:MarR family transcriptional regulator n=1 Tax=Sphaerotilus microaerophilus TaxID=2914710 RepID=A0ABM7YT64_9BURK|nr:MarR family winged helix-turn-helix transcriptional regulator [Sphaerotilus sp. FB-5]BDI07849.1 MarR family transcriptional regulator [Sphaerotilus sp. FB-5]